MLAALILLTGFVCLVSITFAIHASKDPFHPAIILGSLCAFLYAWLPWQLLLRGGLTDFIDESNLTSIQLKNLLGVTALLGGCLWSPPLRWKVFVARQRPVSPSKTLRTAALICGAVGVAAYLVTITNVGGFKAAYGTGYGGGWDDSGYVRDAAILSFSAILLLLFSTAGTRLTRKDLLMLVAFSAPWTIQGILGAKRGPIFMTVTFIALSWCLSRRTRPPIGLTAAAGIAVGFLMLLLLANRDRIYIGSERTLKTDALTEIEDASAGNEYLYGAGAILSAETTGNYFWGRRYFAQVFVRPIPRSVWPNKYADIGLPELEENAGTLASMKQVVGWGSAGAAPGIIADLWLEFSWLYLPAICFIGLAYQVVWRHAITEGSAWSAQYVIISALSVYLVMQTMEAVMFRFIEMSVPIWLAWHLQPRVTRTQRTLANEITPGLRTTANIRP